MTTRLRLAGCMALFALALSPAAFAAETFWTAYLGDLAAFTFDPQTFESKFIMQGVVAQNVYVYTVATDPATQDLWVVYYDYADGLDYLGVWEPGDARPTLVTGISPGLYQFDIEFSATGELYSVGWDYATEFYYLGTIDRATGQVTQILTLDWDFGWFTALSLNPTDGKLYFTGFDCSSACDFFIDTLTVPDHQRAHVWNSGFAVGYVEAYEPFFDSAGGLLFSGNASSDSLGYGYYRATSPTPQKVGSLPTYRGPFGVNTLIFFDSSPIGGAPGCIPSTTQACLQFRRFQVEATYDATILGGGAGTATPNLESDQSLKFSFFDPTNLELFLKVIDGCSYNGHYWVFVSGLTNAGVSLRLTDKLTGAIYTYDSPAGQAFVPRLDIEAFACSQ